MYGKFRKRQQFFSIVGDDKLMGKANLTFEPDIMIEKSLFQRDAKNAFVRYFRLRGAGYSAAPCDI
jgi:hypothetical protein